MVDHHLDNCTECRAELAELSAVMSAMTDALPMMDAPPDLKDRVFATAFTKRPPKDLESEADITLQPVDISNEDGDLRSAPVPSVGNTIANRTGAHSMNQSEHKDISEHGDTSEHGGTSERKAVNRHEGSSRARPVLLRRSSLVVRWLVAGLIVSAASSAVLANQLVHARQQLSQARQQLSSSPKTVSLHAMPSAKDAAGKAVFVQENHQLRLILYAANLKPTNGSEVYHIWLWNHGKRSSAGVMTVGSTGVGQFQGTLKSGHLDGIGITLEPNANTSVPVGPKILGIKNIKID
jgi:hypothetical protein